MSKNRFSVNTVATEVLTVGGKTYKNTVGEPGSTRAIKTYGLAILAEVAQAAYEEGVRDGERFERGRIQDAIDELVFADPTPEGESE